MVPCDPPYEPEAPKTLPPGDRPKFSDMLIAALIVTVFVVATFALADQNTWQDVSYVTARLSGSP